MCVISLAARAMLPHTSFNVLPFFFFFFNDVTLALLFQAFIVLDLATIQSLFVSPELMQLSMCSIFHSNISSCVPRPSQCGAISWLKYVSENIQSASLIILFFAAAVSGFIPPPPLPSLQAGRKVN